MIGTDSTELILASQSPRRRELLQQMEIDFHVHVAAIDEAIHTAEAPEDYVKRMASEKAYVAYSSLRIEHKKFGQLLVLGADTIVVINTQILGKPKDVYMAREHLHALSGQKHVVYTAVALASGAEKSKNPDIQIRVSHSKVEFTTLTTGQIEAYLQTDEPYDKAGSYAVQGLAAQFIKNINGSYSGSMGLPIFETAELLKPYGYTL